MITQSTNLQITPSVKSDETYVSPDLEILKTLQDLIEATFWWNRDTAYYADKLGLSIKRLNRATTFYLNQTVHKLLQNRIQQEAEYQLRYTRHSHKQIAYMLGYSDPAYFCRCFKQHTGKTPTQWRMEMRTTQST